MKLLQLNVFFIFLGLGGCCRANILFCWRRIRGASLLRQLQHVPQQLLQVSLNPKENCTRIVISRDCIVTTAVNCFTSFFSGFVIFTYLGFMSYKQGVNISTVATEGWLT